MLRQKTPLLTILIRLLATRHSENSPALQFRRPQGPSPPGRQNPLSSFRDLVARGAGFPALKRWAISKNPSAPSLASNRISIFLTRRDGRQEKISGFGSPSFNYLRSKNLATGTAATRLNSILMRDSRFSVRADAVFGCMDVKRRACGKRWWETSEQAQINFGFFPPTSSQSVIPALPNPLRTTRTRPGRARSKIATTILFELQTASGNFRTNCKMVYDNMHFARPALSPNKDYLEKSRKSAWHPKSF
jgi:hypothetical protein